MIVSKMQQLRLEVVECILMFQTATTFTPNYNMKHGKTYRYFYELTGSTGPNKSLMATKRETRALKIIEHLYEVALNSPVVDEGYKKIIEKEINENCS